MKKSKKKLKSKKTILDKLNEATDALDSQKEVKVKFSELGVMEK
jgi:hypothetical protein